MFCPCLAQSKVTLAADLDDHAGKLGDEMEEVLAKRLLDGLIEIRPCFEISAIAPAARAQTVCEKFS
jgi:hypothetical protein